MPDSYDKAFPARLRDLLDGKAGTRGKTTQAELAAYLGIPNRQSIAGYANGNNEPGWERIVKIAQYFSVSTDWLLGLTEIESPDKRFKAACDSLCISDRIGHFLQRLSDGEKNALEELLYTADFQNALGHLISIQSDRKNIHDLYQKRKETEVARLEAQKPLFADSLDLDEYYVDKHIKLCLSSLTRETRKELERIEETIILGGYDDGEH